MMGFKGSIFLTLSSLEFNLGRCRIDGSIVHDVSIDASGSFVASAWQAGVSWNEYEISAWRWNK